MLHENSLSELIERTLKVPLNCWVGGTATGGSTTTVVDTSRYEADSFFENQVPVSRVRITSTTDGAAPVGQERRVSASTCATNSTITVGTAFSVAPAAADTYVILSEYTWAEIKEAINIAIDSVVARCLIPKIDESTLVLQTDTLEYNVPTGFTYITKLTQAEDDGKFTYAIPPDHYRIVRTNNVPRIHFYTANDIFLGDDHYYVGKWATDNLVDDRILRVEGFGKQEKLTTDTDICNLDPNYITYYAAGLLHSARIRTAASDYDAHRVQAEVCFSQAKEFLKRADTRFPPDTKKVEW